MVKYKTKKGKKEKRKEKLSVFDSLNRLQILSWQPDSSTRQQLLTPKDTKGKRGQRIYSDTSSHQMVTHWMFSGKWSFSHSAGVEQDNCLPLPFSNTPSFKQHPVAALDVWNGIRYQHSKTCKNDCAYLKLFAQDRYHQTKYRWL